VAQSLFFGHATHYDRPGGATKLDNVATVRIGDHELTRDQARDLIRDYAIRYRATVLWYDMAGDDTDRPDRASATQPVNTVTLADIGRLVAINADLRAGDLSALLTTASEQAFAEVPPDARLQDCPPDSPLYLAATLLYDLFRRPGIGPAKRSKVLHLKRPWLVPIYDSHVHRIYANRAAGLALEIDGSSAGWWEAPRRDLLDSADDFAWLGDACSTDNDVRVRRAGYLPELRLLDILAWTLGSEP
jgi:hypothetical protein